MSDYRSAMSRALFVALLLVVPSSAIWPKRGLAWNDGIPIENFGGSGSQVNWQYNWDSTTSYKQPWAEYVPMLWGTASYHTNPKLIDFHHGVFPSRFPRAIVWNSARGTADTHHLDWFGDADWWLSQGGTGHLLSFNEPDRPDQADMTPHEAADAFRTYMHPYIGRAQLGSPAVSNGGYAWLQDFLGKCSDCHIDFIAAHWYNPWYLQSDFQNWVNIICSLANGRQVWITEFRGDGTPEQESAFLSDAIKFLDNNPCIYRYAYFGTADPDKSLLDNGGPALSALGQQYAFTPYGG